MPENDSAMVKLQALQKELSEQLEAVQVEFNTKALDYQKNAATLSDAVKEMRQKELDGVQQRYQELSQLATQQFQKAQMDLFDPVLKKAQAAIDKVSKENSFTLVFNTANEPLAYYNAATVTDILPLLKVFLGRQYGNLPLIEPLETRESKKIEELDKMADLDALGAAAGVACLCRKKGKKANIVMDPDANACGQLLAQLQPLAEYHDLFSPLRAEMQTMFSPCGRMPR